MGYKITQEDFINAHTIHSSVYITGIFYSGITIYNQQIRTLNLIYFLIKKGLISPANNLIKLNPIIIIGGGVSGITAAMAFKSLQYKVILLEEKSLLLHLQHGCTTRQIHPNLYLWPQIDSLKPFTELPFGNWTAGDAAGIEKGLMKEYELIKKTGKGNLVEFLGIDGEKTKVDLRKKEVSFFQNEKQLSKSFSYLILATGFGLEKYVGRKERTKSYWRNEDYSQLRLSKQICKFFITGTGDGGVSDACRLSLRAFDPLEWALRFENIKIGTNSLIVDLRKIEKQQRSSSRFNYFKEFTELFSKYEKEISKLIKSFKRSDIEDIVLNGSQQSFAEILIKGNLSFINAWLIFILEKMNFIEYSKGRFPDNCGNYLLTEEEKSEHVLIVRHGVDRNWNHFKKLNDSFSAAAKLVEKKQKQKKYNDFSTKIQWELEFWSRQKYTPKRFIVSPKLETLCSIYLTTVNGLIFNYIKPQNTSYRITIHRLINVSNEFYFQQLSNYVGTRKSVGRDVGRAFPLDQGIVGASMRTNSCISLVTQNRQNLFDYKQIFARELPKKITSFLAIPIAAPTKKHAVLCIYLDTDDKQLVKDEQFRKLLYWSLTDFIHQLDFLNVSEFELPTSLQKRSKNISDIQLLKSTKGVVFHTEELKPFIKDGKLLIKENRLVDIYDK